MTKTIKLRLCCAHRRKPDTPTGSSSETRSTQDLSRTRTNTIKSAVCNVPTAMTASFVIPTIIAYPIGFLAQEPSENSSFDISWKDVVFDLSPIIFILGSAASSSNCVHPAIRRGVTEIDSIILGSMILINETNNHYKSAALLGSAIFTACALISIRCFASPEGTVAKQTFSNLGSDYAEVYEQLIQNGILNRIDENTAGLAILKYELNDNLNFLRPDQKDMILPILQQSPERPLFKLDSMIDKEVYEKLIQNGILNCIGDNPVELAISKAKLNDNLDFLRSDQKDRILPILQQSPERPLLNQLNSMIENHPLTLSVLQGARDTITVLLVSLLIGDKPVITAGWTTTVIVRHLQMNSFDLCFKNLVKVRKQYCLETSRSSDPEDPSHASGGDSSSELGVSPADQALLSPVRSEAGSAKQQKTVVDVDKNEVLVNVDPLELNTLIQDLTTMHPGTVAKQIFSNLGSDYDEVYEQLIRNSILNRIDNDTAGLAISKDELDDRLNILLTHQKNEVLPILQQSQPKNLEITTTINKLKEMDCINKNKLAEAIRAIRHHVVDNEYQIKIESNNVTLHLVDRQQEKVVDIDDEGKELESVGNKLAELAVDAKLSNMAPELRVLAFALQFTKEVNVTLSARGLKCHTLASATEQNITIKEEVQICSL